MDLPPWTGVSSSSSEISCCRWTHTCIGNNLGALLSSPLCQKKNQAKTIDFFNAVYKVIISRHIELSSRKLISELISSHLASVWMLWNECSNWKDVLGEEHFKLVTIFHETTVEADQEEETGGEAVVAVKTKQIKVDNVSSVVNLLAIIAARCTNHQHYESAEKEKLGWFRKTADGQWQFDKELYANYWNVKFPQLELFLWWEFHDFRRWTTLDDFYPKLSNFQLDPSQSRNKTRERCTPVMKLFQNFSEALQNEFEKGAVLSRYGKNQETPPILEIWSMHYALVQEILNDHTSIEIKVLDDNVTCLWFCGLEVNDIPVASRVTKFQRGCGVGERSSAAFQGTVFIVNKISNITDSFSSVIKSCVQNSTRNRRTIIFTSSKHLENIKINKPVERELVKKVASALTIDLQKIPISWSEFTEEFTDYLVQQEMILFQNMTIGLTDLLPQNDWVRNQLLSTMNEDMLTNLLRGRNTVFLSKQQKLPCPTANYQERRFYKWQIFNASIFSTIRELPKSEVFVVTGISKRKLKTAVNDSRVKIAVAEKFSSVVEMLRDGVMSKIFLVTSVKPEDDKEIFRNYNKISVNIHCLRYLQQCDQFECVRTHGQFFNVSRLFKESAKAATIDENEWIETCINKSNYNQLMFISGADGTGKACALSSIVEKVVKTCNQGMTIVLSIDMTKLVQDLKKNCTFKDFRRAVVSSMTKLVSSNDFEKSLLEFWLMEGPGNCRIPIEIILQNLSELLVGLQELPSESLVNSDREMAVRVLRLLNDYTTFRMVRIWATLDFVPDDILEEFNSSDFELEVPLEGNCVNILLGHWVNVLEKHDQYPDYERLDKFAKECVETLISKVPAHIAGILLQSQMIAEIHESKVVRGDFALIEKQKSLISLYQKMIDYKLSLVAEPQRDEMDRWYAYFAIKLLFPEHEANAILSLLQLPAEMENEVNSVINGSSGFIHKSFAEFLVARFFQKYVIVPFLNGSGADNDLFLYFGEYLWTDVLAVTYLECNSKSPNVQFKHPNVCYFINELLEGSRFAFSKNCRVTILCQISQCFEIDLFWHTAVIVAPQFASAYKMGFANITAFLVSSPTEILPLYCVMAFCHQFEFVKFTIEAHLHSDFRCWERLSKVATNAAFGKCEYGIIHWVVIGLAGFFQKDIEEIKKFLKYVVHRDPHLLEQRDSKGRTPLLLLLSQFKVDLNDILFTPVLQFLVTELRANVHATDLSGNTVLHFTHECECETGWCHKDKSEFLEKEYVDVVNFFMNNKGCGESVINAVNSKGQTPFLKAYEKFGGNGFRTELERFFQDYGANTTVKREGVCSLFHVGNNEEYLDEERVYQANE